MVLEAERGGGEVQLSGERRVCLVGSEREWVFEVATAAPPSAVGPVPLAVVSLVALKVGFSFFFYRRNIFWGACPVIIA